MTDVATSLAAISGDSREQAAAYRGLVDKLAAAGDVAGLQAVLTRLLSDAVPQGISRGAVSHVAAAVATVADGAARETLATWAVGAIAPQVQSFEDADFALRHCLYDRLLGEGAFKEAACVLSGINMETSAKAYGDGEKAAMYVKIAETFLEDDESVDAETFVTRASSLMHAVPADAWALKLRYRVTLARTLDARRKFLDAAMRYYELSQARHADVDQADLVNLLSKAVTCALLGNAGPQRSRILGLLYKDERVTSQMEQSDAFGAHAKVLKQMFTGQLVRKPEIAAFTATLLPHQKALLGDGLTIPEKATIQHNLVAVSHAYVNVSLAELAALLDVDEARAEAVASRMIADGRLNAKLDQVDGMLHFTDDARPLLRFDDKITSICLAVNACYDKITARDEENGDGGDPAKARA